MKTGSSLLTLLIFALPLLAFGYNNDTNFEGRVASIKGKVLAYGNGGTTIQNLKRGDRVFSKVMIVTRKDSAVRIHFKNRERLILKSSTKVTLNNSLITLKKGLLKFHDPNGEYETYKFKFDNFETIYAGSSLLMGNTSRKPFITALNETKVRITSLNKTKKIISDLRVPDLSKILTRPSTAGGSASTSGDEVVAESTEDDVTSEVEDIFGDGPTEPDESESSAQVDEVEGIFGDEPTIEEAEKAPEFNFKFDDDGEEELIDLLDINWKLGLYSTFYLSKPTEVSQIDSQFAHGDFKLKFNDKIKISDSFNFFHSGWFEISNRKEVRDGNVISFTSRETKKPLLMLNEYYWLKSMNNLDITFGKKVFRMGKGMLVSPADRISPSDSIIPGNSEKLGSFITSIDYYFGDSKFTFLLVPYMNNSKSPHPYSRWSTRTDGTNFDIVSIYPSGFNWESTQNLLKFETTFKGFDFFVAMFNGANSDPVIKNTITTVGNRPDFEVSQEFVPVTNFSSGFSTTFGGLEIHGEVLMQNAKEGRDDAYTTMMGGFRYSFDEWPVNLGLQQIDVIMEYVKETIREEISFPFTLFGSINSRIFRNNLLGTVNFQVHDKLSYNFGFNIDSENSGSAYLFGMGYRFKNPGKVTVRYETFSGKEESLFGIWENNDNIAIEYTKDF